MTITRRHLLQLGSAFAAGAGLPLPFISTTLAASGKIVAGMEAGSPYDTFYRKHAAEFTTKPPASRSSSSRFRTTTSASSSCWMRSPAPAASTSTSPTRCGCRSSIRKGSSRTFRHM